MRRVVLALACLACWGNGAAPAAGAAVPLVADLSSAHIDLTTSFTGTTSASSPDQFLTLPTTRISLVSDRFAITSATAKLLDDPAPTPIASSSIAGDNFQVSPGPGMPVRCKSAIRCTMRRGPSSLESDSPSNRRCASRNAAP